MIDTEEEYQRYLVEQSYREYEEAFAEAEYNSFLDFEYMLYVSRTNDGIRL